MSGKLSSVFVLGATGAVGSAVVKELARHPRIERVTLIGRRKVDLPSGDPNYNKFTQSIIDFDDLSKYTDVFRGFDAGICALGTTRDKSGPEEYYKVDHDYVVNTAKLAKDGGCKHFNFITAAGSNKDSYFLYARTKGQTEAEVGEMGFERLSIYRPPILLVKRAESRPLLDTVLQVIVNRLDHWRIISIDVTVLAKGIVNNLFKTSPPKAEILGNSVMKVLGKLEFE